MPKTKIFLAITLLFVVSLGIAFGLNLINHSALAATTSASLINRPTNTNSANSNTNSNMSIGMASVFMDPSMTPMGQEDSWPTSSMPNPNDQWMMALSVLGYGNRQSGNPSTFADVNGDGLSDIIYSYFSSYTADNKAYEDAVYYLFLNQGGEGYKLVYKCHAASTGPCTNTSCAFTAIFKGDCAVNSVK